MIGKIIENTIIYFRQFVQTVPLYLEGYAFLKKHKPWRSMNNYGWTARALLLVSILLGIFLFKDALLAAKDVISQPSFFGAGISSFFSGLSFEKMDWALHGTKKYLVLIVLELFTFHFIQRTLEIQVGRKPEYTFKAFMEAEKRMIKASIVAYILETITRIIANIFIGLFGLEYLLEKPVGLIIQFYFLGFIIIDNYYELFGFSLKESRKKMIKVGGIATAIGFITYFLMYIPLIGVVIATMLGAVTATLAMQRYAPLEPSEELV
ncbi:MAG: hypothetical protein AAFZ15_14830 [Bacteroidota bacterium]